MIINHIICIPNYKTTKNHSMNGCKNVLIFQIHRKNPQFIFPSIIELIVIKKVFKNINFLFHYFESFYWHGLHVTWCLVGYVYGTPF